MKPKLWMLAQFAEMARRFLVQESEGLLSAAPKERQTPHIANSQATNTKYAPQHIKSLTCMETILLGVGGVLVRGWGVLVTRGKELFERHAALCRT